MSLVSVVREVMDSNGWPMPVTGVSTSQDQNMRQSLALMNKVLLNTSFKKNWPVLCVDYRFTTVPGQGEYDLPVDFHHIIAGSAWNASQYFAMRGALPPAAWYRCMFNGYGDKWFDSFRVDRRGLKFQVCPTPDSAEDLVFMYVSSNAVLDVDGNPKPKYEMDTDVARIDEEMIELGFSARWRQKKGLDYSIELAEYNATVRERYAQYLAAGEIPIGGKCPTDYPLTDGYIGPGPIGV